MVLIVPTVAPQTIEQYALPVAEQWKLGRKKADDGAILVIAKSDHTLRIEVVYGLEGALNDATSKRIISGIITPRFKLGDFYGGITAGVDQMIRVIDGEPLPEPAARPTGSMTTIGWYGPILFILALVIGGLLRSVIGRFSGAIALAITLFSGGMGGFGGGGRRGGLLMGGFGGMVIMNINRIAKHLVTTHWGVNRAGAERVAPSVRCEFQCKEQCYAN